MNGFDKFSPERNQVAKQIKRARFIERKHYPDYAIHRDEYDYSRILGGLNNFFNYLKSLKSNLVLDVGAGAGYAFAGLKDMKIAKGLKLEIVVLRNTPELGKNFKKEEIHVSPGETLRGIKNESVAGVIALNSLAYSTDQMLAAKRIDQILVPGGAIKATFHQHNKVDDYDGALFRDGQVFIQTLEGLNYDVDIDTSGYNLLVLAIKPGNPNAPKATELMNSDNLDYSIE